MNTKPIIRFCLFSAVIVVLVASRLFAGSVVGWGQRVAGGSYGGGFTTIAAGWRHSLGLKQDGSIVAWGNNDYFQCNVPSPNTGFMAMAAGDGHSLGLKQDGSVVVWGAIGQVPSPNAGFVAIAAGEGHSLGLKEDGSIIAWGVNSSGQCNVPSPNTGFVAIAAGQVHSLGLKQDGSIVAWGWNYYGQCNVPLPNTGFVAIAAGLRHSLGLKQDSSIVAWGDNYYGQCRVPSRNAAFVTIATGYYHSLALKQDGSIVAWGSNSHGQCDVPLPNTGFVAIAAGEGHSLGLKKDGSIVAWGGNYSGQCDVTSPNTGLVAIATGGNHSLGLKEDGYIVGWGYSLICDLLPRGPNTGFVGIAAGYYSGQGHSLGLKEDGSIVAWSGCRDNWPSGEPNTGFVAIAAGGYHSLGLKEDGYVVTWGANQAGQCNVPSPNTGFVAIAAGDTHSLGLKQDGSIVAWGRNDYRQCNVPSPNTGFVAISADGYHSLGLKQDGSIVAWGHNSYGQCNVPPPNTGFVAIAAGYSHSLGLKEDGSIVAWGLNYYGECNVPLPNTDFIAIAAGGSCSLGLRGGELALAFKMRSVLPTHAGNLGQAQIEVIGSGFKQKAIVKLVQGATELEPHEIGFVSPWKLQSRFDLTAAPLGKYDIVVTNPDGWFVTLPQCFEIVEGREAHLWTSLRVPPEVRPQRKYTAYVEFGNDGDLALPLPVLKLSNTSGVLMQLGEDGRASNSELLILGTGDRNGQYLLPGEHASVLVRFTAPGASSVDFKLEDFVPDDTPFPWDSVGEFVRPVDASDEQWRTEWQEQTKSVGTTWTEVKEEILNAISNMPTVLSKDFLSILIYTVAALSPEKEGDLPCDFKPEKDVQILGLEYFEPSNRCTYIITNGFRASAEDPPIVALGDKINGACSKCNVLRVNWKKGASCLLPTDVSMNIIPAAQEASKDLNVLFGPNFDWSTVTYIGHSFGNSVNKRIAASHGKCGKGIILDPANHDGYAWPEEYFEGAFAGGSVVVSSASLFDNGPCHPYPRRMGDRQFHISSGLFSAGHGKALDCFTKQLDSCDNDWLTGQWLQTTTAQGAGWYDGIIDCNGKVRPGSAHAACRQANIPVPTGDRKEGRSVVIVPIDPSEKRGNEGYDPCGTPEDLRRHFVRPDERFQYTVFFENEPNATAPAQEVRIVDYLSPCLRWGSVELGEVVFGDHVVTTLAGKTAGHDTVPLKNTPYVVDINAQFDPYTGRLTWTLRTIDPNTSDLPEDPRAGLLPPNDPNHRGEGHVTFNISAQEDLPNAHISNRATIFFDTEAPFDVNVWLNTVDGSPPASAVLPLPTVTIPSRFEVRWSGNDGQGCGIASYDVYVAAQSGPYDPWLMGTTGTSAVFAGLPGYTYRFYCVARDFLGNTEGPPLVPDAQTTLSPINLYYYAKFAAHWLETDCQAPRWCEGMDLNTSQAIDFEDLAVLAGEWLLDYSVMDGP
jgi:alpha-tubulin suppressor-like RCC1 family protein